jgi:glycosyltransferase involved in cell wall biosynthesis
VLLTDLLPPRLRYGYVHRLTKAIFATPLPSVASVASVASVGEPERESVPQGDSVVTAGGTTTCVLAAPGLDVGGIGSVIEMLARGLGDHGVRPVVVCEGDGSRAARLRDAGITVVAVSDEESADAAIRTLAPDVIQSHSAPSYLERAVLRSDAAVVPVMHNTEIHYTRQRWSEFAALMAGSTTGIAVSETVREFHLRHIGDGTPIVVVPNGAPEANNPTSDERQRARDGLSRLLGAEIGDDIVFVCLARYDSQKNIAGLVAAFGVAIERSTLPLRLICAGDPSDWAEFRRAEALRVVGRSSDRIHLLGNSDARVLLTAADAFVLDSFFEGWPVAATEAAAYGHPLLLSDVGGARELVAQDPDRSRVIPNATGEASLVTDRRVRAARRRSRNQANARALQQAVEEIARTVASERSHGRDIDVVGTIDRAGVGTMIASHAEVIRTAARVRRGGESAPGGAEPGRA